VNRSVNERINEETRAFKFLYKFEKKLSFILSSIYRMIRSRPLDYTFVPQTWIFPAEYTQFQNYVKELKKKRKQKTFIVKPANGAMGHG
jgi:vacuolar-type H+-ATPase subunit I/STV1